MLDSILGLFYKDNAADSKSLYNNLARKRMHFGSLSCFFPLFSTSSFSIFCVLSGRNLLLFLEVDCRRPREIWLWHSISLAPAVHPTFLLPNGCHQTAAGKKQMTRATTKVNINHNRVVSDPIRSPVCAYHILRRIFLLPKRGHLN